MFVSVAAKDGRGPAEPTRRSELFARAGQVRQPQTQRVHGQRPAIEPEQGALPGAAGSGIIRLEERFHERNKGPDRIAFAMLAASPAGAFTIVPDDDDPGRIVVVIERDYGEVVPLRALPPPYNRIVQDIQGPDGLSFRWRQFRSTERGMAYIHVFPDGVARMHFEFHGQPLADGDTLGAAAVLADAEGKAMHTFLARADVVGEAFASGGNLHRVRLEIERPPEWWRRVDAIAFFHMKYYSVQAPDREGVWNAMRRAVERFTRGEGTRQQADGL